MPPLPAREPRRHELLRPVCHANAPRTSDRLQAQRRLTIATVMYREMDMRFWLEQAEVDRET